MEKGKESLKRKAVATEENNSKSQKLDKLDAIIKQLACSNPSILLYQEKFKQKLCKLPLSHTPDHPTYAAMIERAITELNEEEGSSEEAISKFIEAKYQDLPLAHSGFLSHHLEVLVKKADIVCTPNNCYKLQDENIDSSIELKRGQKRLSQHKVEGGQSQEQQNVVSELENPTHKEENGAQGHQLDEFEDQHQSQEEHTETSTKQKREVTDKKIHTEERQIEVIEKQTQVDWQQPVEEMVDDQKQADESLAHEKGPEVNEENNQAQGKELEGIGDRKQAEEQQEQQNVVSEVENPTHNEENSSQGHQLDEFEDQHQSQEKHIETSKKEKQEVTDKQIHTEERQTEVTEKQTQVDWQQPVEEVVDDQKQADESLAHEKGLEVSEENNQAQGKELEGIGDQKQAEEKEIESIEKQKEVELVELIVEQNEANEKDQQLGELNEPQSQVLKRQIEVLAELRNQAEKKIKGTEEPQGGVEDEVIEEECDKDEQQSEATEEKNQPQDKQVKDIAEQVQSQEMKIAVIKEQAKRQGQQNELTEEQKRLGEQQMEICYAIMDLSNTVEQLMKKQEESEATVTTPSSSLTCQKSDHFGSLLLSKKECIELLSKANKIQGRLIEIVSSLTVMEVPEHNTFEPMIREEPKIFLEEHLLMKSPCNGKECMLPNLKRPPEVELTTLEEFCQKQKKQAKLCGQQVTPKSQPKSMGIAPDVCTNPSLEEAPQRVFGDIDRIPDFNSTTEANTYIQGEAAITVKAMKKISLNAPAELKENDLEQQSELPRTGRPPQEYEQQQQSDLQKLKMSLEAKVSTVEKEVRNSDVIFNSEDVEHYQQPDPSLSETYVDHQLPNSERPPDLKQIVEQLSQELQHCDKVDQQQQSKNSIEERRREHELTAVNQPCQTQQQSQGQQQENRQSQPQDKKPYDSEVDQQQQRKVCPQGPGTAVMTDFGVPLASLKSRLKQKAKSPICNGPQEPRPTTVGELSISVEQQVNHHGVPVLVQTQQQQQTRGSEQGRITRGRAAAAVAAAKEGPSQPEPAVDETMAEQYEQQKQGRGRPRKSNSDVNNAERESLPLDDQHHHEQQQQQPLNRGRGRPPKIKPGTGKTMDALLPPQHMDQREEKQVQGRGRGRRPKSKQPADTTEDSLLPLQYQCLQPEQQPHGKGKGGPTKSNPTTVTVTDTLLPSQQQQQQTQGSGQGRYTRAAAIVASLKQQQQAQYKGRGRPPKQKYDSDSATNNLLTSQNHQWQPKRQRR